MTHHLRPQRCTVPGCREVAAYTNATHDGYWCPFHAVKVGHGAQIVKLPSREVKWGGREEVGR